MEIDWKRLGGSIVLFVLIVSVLGMIISLTNFCYYDSSKIASQDNDYGCMVDKHNVNENPEKKNLVLLIMLTRIAIPLLALTAGILYYFKEQVGLAISKYIKKSKSK
jgi:hypothetical protein